MNSIENTEIDDTFLATRLYVPALRADSVPRERLLRQLDRGLQSRLTLVCAPAGFGKTTLLSEWIHSFEGRFPGAYSIAWISLVKEDNDISRFWSYLLRTLQLDPRSLAANPGHSDAAVKQMVTLFINRLSRLTKQLVLVLDDYHVIAEPRIHQSIQFLLDHLPSTMHLVIASRTHLPFSLARLRSQHYVTELHTESLRFTSQEITSYIRRRHTIELSDEAIAQLEQHLEGWIARLQLATLSIENPEHLASVLTNISGNKRYIFEYLCEEVLTRLPEQTQYFLLTTSILSSMCAGLCDAITGQQNSQQVFDQLEQGNVFLVPLDTTSCWYRYHHLFSETLYHRLEQTQSTLIPELHQRACSWYEQHGYIDEAIEHTLAINDFEHAARLLETIGERLLRQGMLMSLERRIKRLPESVIQSRPALQMMRFWLLTSYERWDEADHCLKNLEQLLEEHAGAASFTVGLKVAHSFLAQSRGDFSQAIHLMQSALALVSLDDYGQRCYMQLHMAKSYWLNANLDDAKRAILEGIRVSEFGGYNYFVVVALLELAYLQVTQGQLSLAQTTCQQALKIIDTQRESTSILAGALHVALGVVLYEKNELHAAQKHLIQSITCSQVTADAHTLFQSRILLARIKLSSGNETEAREAVQDIAFMTATIETLFPFTFFMDYYVDVHVALGMFENAADLLERYTATPLPPFLYDEIHRAQIDLLYATRRDETAPALLEPILVRAEAQKNTRGLIKALILRACLYKNEHNVSSAIDDLTHALSLAEPRGFIRIFLDEGTSVKDLLTVIRDTPQKHQDRLSTVSSSYL